MANRYLVGTGARQWNNTATWSDTSGGAGGASVPTDADNVFFDANSGTGTLTINATASCADFDVTALAATITLANAAYAFNVHGNLKLGNYLNTSFTGTGYLYLRATTQVGIWANGTTKEWNRIYMNGVGGTWTNQDNWNAGSSTVYHYNGAWNTHNFTFTSTSDYILQLGVSNGKSLTLGSSYFYVRDFNGSNGTIWGQWSLNAGTSNIICSRTFIPKTVRRIFYNVSSKYIDAYLIHIFNNLTVVSDGTLVQNSAYLYKGGSDDGIIVYDTFTLKAYNSTTHRAFLNVYTIGTPVTMNVNNAVFENVDFRDAIGAGNFNWDLSNIVGGSGDCGGNSGITFTPAVPQYYKHAGGGTALWSDATKWFSDSNLTIAGRVPLPQDDANFIAGSFSEACTVSVNVPRIGRSLDMELVNQAVTMSLANAVQTHGGIKFGATVTLSGNFLIEFIAHGKTLPVQVYAGVPISFVNNFNVVGNGIFNELIIAKGYKVRFTGGSTQTITKITAAGKAGNPITITSTTNTKANLEFITVQNIDWCNISYINVTLANKLFAGVNSVDGGNNINIVFGEVAELIAAVEFTEAEVIESTLLGEGMITPAFTESETLAANAAAKAYVANGFSEHELAGFAAAAMAVVNALYEETDLATVDFCAAAAVAAGYTEYELIDAIAEGRFLWEPVKLRSAFLLLLTARSGFTKKIVVKTRFK